MGIRDYASVLTATVEHLFPKGTAQVQGKVFLVTVGIEIYDYSNEENPQWLAADIHLAIRADRNYVGVFAAAGRIGSGWRGRQWACVAFHDSCWRDGIDRTLETGHDDLVKVARQRFVTPAEQRLSETLTVSFMGILDVADVFGAEMPSQLVRKSPDMDAAASE